MSICYVKFFSKMFPGTSTNIDKTQEIVNVNQCFKSSYDVKYHDHGHQMPLKISSGVDLF